MLSRRAFVGKLAAGAAGAAVASAASLGRASVSSSALKPPSPRDIAQGAAQFGSMPETVDASQPAPVAETASPARVGDAGPSVTLTAPPPWDLLHPLALGSGVAHGWRVAELSGVADGACVLTLENQRGRTHRVHLCRNDGRPQGLVYTDRLDLVVMNGGRGDLPTEEGLAQAVAEVAHVLAANERKRQQEQLVAELLPQAERIRLYSSTAVDRKLR